MKKLFLTFFCALVFQVVFSQYSFDSSALRLNLKALSSDLMEGRKTGTEGSKKAQAFIIDHLKKTKVAPFVPEYKQAFTITHTGATLEGANILGVIPGKEKKTIVISAHYDHLGIRNNSIYNGADDNASGTTALMALVTYFKKHKPNHRLIIAFFDSEEMGLKGSSHFVNSLDQQKEKVVLNINLDMVSRTDKNELYACGGFSYPDVKKKLENLKTKNGLKLLFGHDDPATGNNDWTNQSDHYSFHQKKIPFVYFGVEDHHDYHRATDDFEKVNIPSFANSVETILNGILALDR